MQLRIKIENTEHETLTKIKGWKHEKEFDTQTRISDIGPLSEGDTPDNSGTDKRSDDTRKAMDLKTITDAESRVSDDTVTQVYEPRPLTPDDDIYEDILEQFASEPTKPKYWFEEFGDYWSCSCGHINKGCLLYTSDRPCRSRLSEELPACRR